MMHVYTINNIHKLKKKISDQQKMQINNWHYAREENKKIIVIAVLHIFRVRCTCASSSFMKKMSDCKMCNLHNNIENNENCEEDANNKCVENIKTEIFFARCKLSCL
ncbi:hypothetical protein ACKWTF_015065 [Chironomus riparius]